jgi:hypothetical protein
MLAILRRNDGVRVAALQGTVEGDVLRGTLDLSGAGASWETPARE